MKITFGRSMRGYTVAYANSNQLSKPQIVKRLNLMIFPHPSSFPLLNHPTSVMPLPNLGLTHILVAQATYITTLKPRRVTMLCHLHKPKMIYERYALFETINQTGKRRYKPMLMHTHSKSVESCW